MMHDNLVFALFHGVPGSEQPWGDEESVKFLCPGAGLRPPLRALRGRTASR